MKSTLNRELKARETDCSLTGETSKESENDLSSWPKTGPSESTSMGKPERSTSKSSDKRGNLKPYVGSSPSRLETRSKEFSTCAKAYGSKPGKV